MFCSMCNKASVVVAGGGGFKPKRLSIVGFMGTWVQNYMVTTLLLCNHIRHFFLEGPENTCLFCQIIINIILL